MGCLSSSETPPRDMGSVTSAIAVGRGTLRQPTLPSLRRRRPGPLPWPRLQRSPARSRRRGTTGGGYVVIHAMRLRPKYARNTWRRCGAGEDEERARAVGRRSRPAGRERRAGFRSVHLAAAAGPTVPGCDGRRALATSRGPRPCSLARPGTEAGCSRGQKCERCPSRVARGVRIRGAREDRTPSVRTPRPAHALRPLLSGWLPAIAWAGQGHGQWPAERIRVAPTHLTRQPIGAILSP